MNLTHIIAVLFFAKLIVAGSSYADCIGTLVALSAVQLDRVTGYIFPKRPEIDIPEMTAKIDQLESDVTGLKISTRAR